MNGRALSTRYRRVCSHIRKFVWARGTKARLRCHLASPSAPAVRGQVYTASVSILRINFGLSPSPLIVSIGSDIRREYGGHGMTTSQVEPRNSLTDHFTRATLPSFTSGLNDLTNVGCFSSQLSSPRMKGLNHPDGGQNCAAINAQCGSGEERLRGRRCTKAEYSGNCPNLSHSTYKLPVVQNRGVLASKGRKSAGIIHEGAEMKAPSTGTEGQSIPVSGFSNPAKNIANLHGFAQFDAGFDPFLCDFS